MSSHAAASSFTILGLAPGPDNPLGMLYACHQRLIAKLDTLSRVLEVYEQGDQERYDQAAGALGMVMRHMHTATRQHTEDEEFSLFPRLVEADPAWGERLMAIEADHEALEARWDEFEPMLVALAEGIDPTPQVVARLRELVGPWVADYRRHLKFEEEAIFAKAATQLTPETLAAIGEEMGARRQLV